MTVGQLIEWLHCYPADMPVLVDGADDCGYDDVRIEALRVVPADLGPNSGLGRYDRTDDDDTGGTNALVFERAR